MLAPVMPEPMITYLVEGGRSGVVRWSEMGRGGVCQYDFVGLGKGNPVRGVVEAIVSVWFGLDVNWNAGRMIMYNYV